MTGAINAEHLDDIEKCITDFEHIYQEAGVAVDDFEKGGAANVIAGLSALGHTFLDLESGFKDCASSKTDLEKLEQMAEILRNPTEFVYHVGKDLIINHAEIYGDIKAAIADYRDQKYYDYGVDVGKAAAKTLLGEDQHNQVMDTLEGVITEFGGAEVFKTINQCTLELGNDTIIIQKMESRILEGMFKDEDIVTSWSDFFSLVFGVKDVIFQLNRCKTWDRKSWDSLSLNKSFAFSGNPSRYLEIDDTDVLINGKSIAQLAKEAANAGRAGNFKQLGSKFA